MPRRWIPDGPDRPAISADIKINLVDALYANTGAILLGCFGSLTASLFCFARGERHAALAWAIGSIVVTAFRLWLARAYRVRAAGDDPTLWANRFAVGATLNSALWGTASASVVFHPDPFLQMVIISAQAAYVTGAAVHNSAFERAAIAQITLPIGCLVVACLLTGDPYLAAYGGFAFVGLVAAAQITHVLNRTMVDLLIAEERAARACQDLAQVNARLESLATTDGLTGASNRRGFDIALAQECARAMRDHRTCIAAAYRPRPLQGAERPVRASGGDACLMKLALLPVEHRQTPRRHRRPLRRRGVRRAVAGYQLRRSRPDGGTAPH